MRAVFNGALGAWVALIGSVFLGTTAAVPTKTNDGGAAQVQGRARQHLSRSRGPRYGACGTGLPVRTSAPWARRKASRVAATGTYGSTRIVCRLGVDSVPQYGV